MLEFAINEGTREGAIEISFNAKPSEEVRTALKSMKMRWNKVKQVWYGFVDEVTASEAIKKADAEAEQAEQESLEEIKKEFSVKVTDGYMGALETIGSKSGKFLYGAELSKAIRQDLKRCHIKSTVRCETYTGGQSITVTLEVNENDYVPECDFIAQYSIYDACKCCHWIHIPELGGDVQVQDLTCGDVFTAEQKEAARVYLAKQEYARYWNSGKKDSDNYVNREAVYPARWGKSNYKMFTQEAFERMQLAEKVILAYHHDGSNTMVDYFDVNFYYDIELKNVA